MAISRRDFISRLLTSNITVQDLLLRTFTALWLTASQKRAKQKNKT